MLYMANGIFADAINLGIWDESILDYQGGPTVIHNILIRGRQEVIHRAVDEVESGVLQGRGPHVSSF